MLPNPVSDPNPFPDPVPKLPNASSQPRQNIKERIPFRPLICLKDPLPHVSFIRFFLAILMMNVGEFSKFSGWAP
jgi:hypothetical protein